MGPEPVLQREPQASSEPEVTVRYDRHRLVPGRAGELLSATLLAAGVLATSRSLKFRRPRGPWCLRGDCGTCLVRIDGRPNQRACMTPIRHGMEVEPQNRVGPGGVDPTGLADKMFGAEMDHHHFMLRPRVLNQLMMGVARNLAGLGTLPTPAEHPAARHRHHRVDALVVGAGPSGRATASTIRAAGFSCVLLDRLDPPGWSEPPGRDDLPGTGVFGIYGPEAKVAAVQLAPSAESGEPDVLHTFEPRHLIFATGAREPMLPVQGNDLPGVLAARGLQALLRRHRMRPARGLVVIRQDDQPGDVLPGHTSVRIDDVLEIEGSGEVEAVRTRGGRMTCALVALAPRPAPASDLPRQAGTRVRFDGAGFAVLRDDHGRCEGAGPWQVWATGEVCGVVGATQAAADGARVGRAVASALKASSRPGERGRAR